MKTNEVRPIDANALKKSFEEDGHLSSYIEEFIDNAPTIDAVPIVRCKDCKWHGRPGCAIEIVDDSDRPGTEGFCCYAERKQDGGADDDAE